MSISQAGLEPLAHAVSLRCYTRSHSDSKTNFLNMQSVMTDMHARVFQIDQSCTYGTSSAPDKASLLYEWGCLLIEDLAKHITWNKLSHC